VYQDRSGAIWAATVNAGVSKYWKGRFTTYSKAHGMASDTVFSIEESPDGTLWFATPNGLNAFSKGQWRVYTTLDGLPSDNVSCLLSDSSGILWIGTGAGLAYLRSGHIQKVSDTASSLQEEILGIAADHIGNLWIATSNHILSVKRERLLSTTTTKSDLRDYGLEDGLAGTQGIKRFRSVVTDAQGRIWFSTSRGLSVVDPSRAGREPPYVTVQIEGFSAYGNSLNLQPPIRVPPDTHRLSFSYSGLSLSTPERIQFKYKLDGFDNDWSEPVSTRAAVYTNVGWGAYTFRVMASNSAGAWNTQSVALPFSIAPTWYQTRTYRVLLAASLLLGGWALYRWRVHQLTVQERRMRDVVDTIPAMTFTTSPDGSSTFVNKGWIEYTGLSVEQTSGAGWQRAIHPDDLARHSEKWRISVTTGQLFEDEARFRRSADGKYRWFLVRGVPLRDQHKKIVKWYGTLTDIEDRRRAEEGLQRSQFYINEGQRLAQMGSWAFNPLGFFDYWSDELFQIYGLDSKKGAPTLDQYLATLHPQDRDSMAETIKTMHIERCGCDVKKRIVRPDGQLRYVRCVGIPVVEDEVLRGFLGTAIDITDQELLTRELEHQRAYLTEAQKLTHTGSWVWRVSDRFAIHLSEEWYRIYDFNLAEGPPPWEKRLERVYLEDRLKWKGAIERALAEKTDYDVEFRILLPSGTVKWIHTVGHPVFSDAGELVQFVGISTDITERKSAEWERERLHQLENDLAHINRVSMLGEMAASLAHEIKQPIAAAITSANSCIEWLAHDPPNLDRARAAVARIDKYGNRAAQIIDHIRSFYKQAPSQYELVDANGIVEEIFTLLQDDAIRYSITMRPELAAQMPRIIADRVQLQQVFMNLMLNAIEAMHTSGGELTVRSQSKDGQLLFSVSDTGLGLPTENVDQIYSPFYTTKQQGSGMGLAISRTIVESYGGRLWATANNGRGATFHFTLPAEAKDSSPSST
jgi:PAS domain S-box-containing protein